MLSVDYFSVASFLDDLVRDVSVEVTPVSFEDYLSDDFVPVFVGLRVFQ